VFIERELGASAVHRSWRIGGHGGHGPLGATLGAADLAGAWALAGTCGVSVFRRRQPHFRFCLTARGGVLSRCKAFRRGRRVAILPRTVAARFDWILDRTRLAENEAFLLQPQSSLSARIRAPKFSEQRLYTRI